MDSIDFAQRLVYSFKSEDPIVAASQEAEKCHQFEEKLNVGIKAATYILIASEMVRDAYTLETDIGLNSDELEVASSKIRHLYKWWMEPTEYVEEQISFFVGQGYTINEADTYFEMKKKISQKLRVYAMRDASEEAYNEGFFDDLIERLDNDRESRVQ